MVDSCSGIHAARFTLSDFEDAGKWASSWNPGFLRKPHHGENASAEPHTICIPKYHPPSPITNNFGDIRRCDLRVDNNPFTSDRAYR